MTVHHYSLEQIHADPNRQRKTFDGSKIIELANSIQVLGLLQPIVLQHDGTLVAGERRTKALRHLEAMGVSIRCGDETFAPGDAPVIFFDSDNELKLWEAQLDENIKRENLTWQEQASAVELLHRLRKATNPAQTTGKTAAEIYGLASETSNGSYGTGVRDSIIVSKHLEDKEIASAGSIKDAMKILKKREKHQRLVRLSENIDVKTLSSQHSLYHSDFRSVDIPPGSVDVILTDPPYGMGAQGFGDGGGAIEVPHEYDDSGEQEWREMMVEFARFSILTTKPKAHLYVFCDIDQFHYLRGLFTTAGWWVHRTPLVYAKSHASSRRVPWPEHGPRRGYELVLYAVKGKRQVNTVVSDVFGADTDENLGHAAQKPVGAYTNLLRRSVAAGDTVLDPFCGTGTIFPAAHELHCRAVGIECDPAFIGISWERLVKLQEV